MAAVKVPVTKVIVSTVAEYEEMDIFQCKTNKRPFGQGKQWAASQEMKISDSKIIPSESAYVRSQLVLIKM